MYNSKKHLQKNYIYFYYHHYNIQHVLTCYK